MKKFTPQQLELAKSIKLSAGCLNFQEDFDSVKAVRDVRSNHELDSYKYIIATGSYAFVNNEEADDYSEYI